MLSWRLLDVWINPFILESKSPVLAFQLSHHLMGSTALSDLVFAELSPFHSAAPPLTEVGPWGGTKDLSLQDLFYIEQCESLFGRSHIFHPPQFMVRNQHGVRANNFVSPAGRKCFVLQSPPLNYTPKRSRHQGDKLS